MIRYLFITAICFTLALFLTCLLHGCVGDKVIYTVPSANKANTFVFSEKHWGGKVMSVYVLKHPSQIVWKVEATRNIPVRDFSVTVGVVPDGFKQTIPAYPSKFSPNKGEEYIIEINCDFWPSADSIGTAWIAQ
jgi:hypothetical protein